MKRMTYSKDHDAHHRPPNTFAFTSKFLGEPQLLFADGGECVDPRLGISTFGPESFGSSRHPSVIRVGFIGTADTIDASKEWMHRISEGITENEGEQPFPGMRSDRGFFTDMSFSTEWDESMTRTELKQIKAITADRERFEASHGLLHDKARLICERDTSPDVLVVALPQGFVDHARVVDYWERGRGQVHRDLRRAFKAMAMKSGIPTQIILSRTVRGGKGVDLEERRAWNLLTAMYFKAGGVPWKPLGLTEGTCYIGISFYRPLGNLTNTLRTSVAMAFDESGEGLVLRGQEFSWSEDDGPSPHLNAEQAESLLSSTLARYKQERKTTPRRVVIHKTSVFWPGEREGFEAALAKHVTAFDLLAFAPSSHTRLVRQGQYPPLRGTWFSADDLDFLYTTGYVPELGAYTHGHVPSPLRIADHIGGDTPRESLLREILVLTKLNWNSANLGGLLPITLRFSRLVGDVLREMPDGEAPRPQFKFYV
jgi:hypothetical protein